MTIPQRCLHSASSLRSRARRRVVVTGMGLVTCLGVGVQHVWNNLINGRSGLRKLDGEEYDSIPCKVAGTVPRGTEPGHLHLENHFTASDQKVMSLATCYSVLAADEALSQARWKPQTDEEKHRTGVAVGMGMVPMEEIVDTGVTLSSRGYKRVSPFFVPKILVNMAAGQISLKHSLKGVNHAVSTACTTGAHTIGDASRFIEHGDVDVMVCGGAEACVGPLAIAGFARMRALATNYNDRPEMASRPFDGDREGFVMSEGAGILVLEELEHAEKRGAKIYCEVLGYGLSGDANHMTAPSEDGNGAYRCMQGALNNAGVEAQSVGYINAHATSTPLGDAAEARAISKIMGDSSEHLAVSSTKGAVGHLLGAAGSVEAIFTIMAIHTGQIPPTLNCHKPDQEFKLNFVPNQSQEWNDSFSHRVAITNSFGFGGTNASLCFGNML